MKVENDAPGQVIDLAAKRASRAPVRRTSPSRNTRPVTLETAPIARSSLQPTSSDIALPEDTKAMFWRSAMTVGAFVVAVWALLPY